MNIVSLGITITVLLILLGIIFPKSKFFLRSCSWLGLLFCQVVIPVAQTILITLTFFLTADTHSINGISVTNGVFSFFWQQHGGMPD